MNFSELKEAEALAYNTNIRARRGMGMVIGVVVKDFMNKRIFDSSSPWQFPSQNLGVRISRCGVGYIVLATTVNSAATAAVNLTSTQSVNLASIATSVTGAFLRIFKVRSLVRTVAYSITRSSRCRPNYRRIVLEFLKIESSKWKIHASERWGRWNGVSTFRIGRVEFPSTSFIFR